MVCPSLVQTSSLTIFLQGMRQEKRGVSLMQATYRRGDFHKRLRWSESLVQAMDRASGNTDETGSTFVPVPESACQLAVDIRDDLQSAMLRCFWETPRQGWLQVTTEILVGVLFKHAVDIRRWIDKDSSGVHSAPNVGCSCTTCTGTPGPCCAFRKA